MANSELYGLRVLAAMVASDWPRVLHWRREGLSVFGLEWPLEGLAEVGMMTTAADGMQRLVDSILQFAQVGQGVVDRQHIASADVIEVVRVTLAAAMQDTGATIQYGKLPVIEAGRTQMEQVFQNLIANGTQYSIPGNPPIISISAASTDTRWIFSVQDNGQGYLPNRWS